ncbi:MAG: ribosome silencing factor [Alphaproteobacteria bacterium GM7ARS4]|nr:ribosome silencing factor [Alphaproteobacteria bacterium GM7ARS4]
MRDAHREIVPCRDKVRMITRHLDSYKAEDIVTIPLQGKSILADYMVIASGNNARHVKALADKLIRRFKGKTPSPIAIEGMARGDWVLLDMGDIIVHLFKPEVRLFYRLEKLWMSPAHRMAQNAQTKATTTAEQKQKPL